MSPVAERAVVRFRHFLAEYVTRFRDGDGEDLLVCTRCLNVMEDESRCQACGRHGGES